MLRWLSIFMSVHWRHWPGSTCNTPSVYSQGFSARIESARALASPMGEELAAAKAWQRRSELGLPPTATDAECEAAEAYRGCGRVRGSSSGSRGGCVTTDKRVITGPCTNGVALLPPGRPGTGGTQVLI